MLRNVLLLAVSLTLGLALACSTSDDRQTQPVAVHPENTAGLWCDVQLRQFFTDEAHPVADADAANLAVAYVQSQHASQCPTSRWNPLVSKVAVDDAGNIDVSFATQSPKSGSATFTTNGEGSLRWVFLVADGRWYATKPHQPAVLEAKRSEYAKPTAGMVTPVPTSTPEPTATPITDRDVYEEAYATCNGYYRGIEVIRRKQIARIKSLEGLRDSLRRNCDGAVAAVAANLGVTPVPLPTWPPTAAPLPTWTPVPTHVPTWTPLPPVPTATWAMPSMQTLIARRPTPTHSVQATWGSPTPTPLWSVVRAVTPTPIAPVPVLVPTPAATTTLDVADVERYIISFTNDERKKAGLTLLQHDPAVSAIARRHSQNMGRQDNMNHVLDGKDASDRAADAGYECRAYRPDGSYTFGLAENIINGTQVKKYTKRDNGPWVANGTRNSEQVAKDFIKWWMNSPGHRKNILTPDYRRIGVGVATTPEKQVGLPWRHVWATQNFSKCATR